MRDLLFRAKRMDNGEWVEGKSIVSCISDRDGQEYFIVAAGGVHTGVDENGNIVYAIPERGCLFYKVDPETMGQYTGLTDKNGKKIFEGDIVRIRGDQTSADWKWVDYTALIAFIDGGFCAIDGTVEEHGFRRYGLHRMDFDLEVIGTIHDNPELLEEESQ